MRTTNQKVKISIRQRTQGKNPARGSVHIHVSIDGVAEMIPLKISWPVDKFDNGVLLPRDGFEDDTLCTQNNFRIQNERSRVDALVFRYYALDRAITHELIRREVSLKISKDDIVAFIKGEGRQLLREHLIEHGTYKHYVTVIARIEKYFKETGSYWKFNTIDDHELRIHQRWLLDNFTHNTTAGHMRVIKKFLTMAVSKGLIPESPADKLKTLKYQDGIREVLTKDEINKLYNFYIEDGTELLTELEHTALRRYLVACFTGLRKSDIEQLDPRLHIRNNNILRLSMFKTRKYGKVIEFTLPKIAVELIGKKRGIIFPTIESYSLGKALRRALVKAGIDKYMKFHSSRDTFATTFILLGGNPVDLMEILGHSDLKTTMIYVKMASDSKSKTMQFFDELVK